MRTWFNGEWWNCSDQSGRESRALRRFASQPRLHLNAVAGGLTQHDHGINEHAGDSQAMQLSEPL